MKSIFKKIALVLALAMVVTMLPAKSASLAAAAAEPNKWVRNTCTLYLDAPVPMDKYSTYVSEAYATKKAKVAKDDAEGWGTLGYTVSFETDDPSIASVGTRYGLVTATGIGQTTITATFSKEGEEDIVESFTVTVKSYAHSIALDKESEDAVNALVVGSDPVTLKAVVTDAEGNSETIEKVGGDTKLAQLFTEREYVTDYVKFEVKNPEDKEVLHYDKETNQLTAVAEGEATLTAIAYRWDWTPNVKTNAGWYAWRTVTQEYTVTVKEVELEAVQTAYNAITITFGSEEDAKTAIDASRPALNNSDAAVTEKKEIIKIYQVLKDSENSERTRYFNGLSQDGNKVTVTLFEEMEEKTDYVVRYQNQEMKLSTGEYIANNMEIVETERKSTGEDSSEVTLGFKIFSIGENNQPVDISGAKKYVGWDTTVELEDMNQELYHSEYTFDAAARKIWFFTRSESCVVNLKASFSDWYTAVGPEVEPILAYTSIKANSSSFSKPTMIGWGIVKQDAHIENNDKAFNQTAFAAEDTDRKLVIKISYMGKEINSCENDGLFEFVSSNDDKLTIDKTYGFLYPSKKPEDGRVLVHVYYDKQYVTSCPVTVYAKRVLSGFTAELDDSKLDYNSDATKDVNDVLKLTLEPVDQLQEPFTDNVEFKAELNGTASDYVVLTRDESDKLKWNVSVPASSKLTNTVMTFRIVCTATYDDGLSPKITKQYSVPFTAKDTNGMVARSYDFSLDNKVEVDMKLAAVNDIAAKTVKISAYSYDRDGFKIEKLPLTAAYGEQDLQTANNSASVAIRLGNDYVDAAHLVASDGKTLVFKTVLDKQDAKITTVSGDAVTVSGSAITKVKEGTYSVNLFIGNGEKAMYRNSRAVVVKDSQEKPGWNWVKYATSTKVDEHSLENVIEVVRECFSFGENGKEKYSILIRTDEKEGDYRLRGNSLSIQRVRRVIMIGDQVFEQIIDVNRTVTVNGGQ